MDETSGLKGRNRRSTLGLLAAIGSAAPLTMLLARSARAEGRHSESRGPNCLLRGTLVQTHRGEVAVEDLSRSDFVLTESGHFKPVNWIGRQTFRRAPGAAWAASVSPVTVAQSAIAPNVPHRDVSLSPEHALYMDGYLIPVKLLVNGMSITQGDHSSHVIDYFHIECADHQVIYAEGLAVETLRITTDAPQFANIAERDRLFGSRITAGDSYAPVLSYWCGRHEALALLRQVASIFVDLRNPIQVAHDRIAERARSRTGVAA